MFRAYVQPIVDYNSEIFSPYLLKDIRMLERAQRAYTKRIPGMRNLSYAQRLQSLSLQSLEEKRLRVDLNLTFRIMKGLVDIDFADFFEFSDVVRTRGNSLKLKIPRCYHDPAFHFFTNRIPPVWNALPDAVVTAPSLGVFKSRLSDIDLTRHLKLPDIG